LVFPKGQFQALDCSKNIYIYTHTHTHTYICLLRINALPEPIFADYTSVIISNINFTDFYKIPKLVLPYVSEWLATNK
jgi:hypothetical protein